MLFHIYFCYNNYSFFHNLYYLKITPSYIMLRVDDIRFNKRSPKYSECHLLAIITPAPLSRGVVITRQMFLLLSPVPESLVHQGQFPIQYFSYSSLLSFENYKNLFFPERCYCPWNIMVKKGRYFLWHLGLDRSLDHLSLDHLSLGHLSLDHRSLGHLSLDLGKWFGADQ